MILSQFTLLAILLATSHSIIGAPVPDDSSLDAMVERSGDDIMEFDLERRQKGDLCSPLSAKELEKLPGFAKLKEKAKANWGGGKYELVTNPADYPDRPAYICGQTSPVQIKGGKPSCNKNKNKLSGSLSGTDGSVSQQVTTGTNYQIQTSTTRTASVGTGVTSTVGLEIPGLAKAETSFSVTTTLSNAIGKTTSETKNNQQATTVTMDSKDGKACEMELETSTCTTQGSGSFKYLAEGFVWFNYHSKTKGHYKWSLNLNTLSESDRSSTMTFDALIRSETKSVYKGTCSASKGGAKNTKANNAKASNTTGKKPPAKGNKPAANKPAPAKGSKATPAKQPTKAAPSKGGKK